MDAMIPTNRPAAYAVLALFAFLALIGLIHLIDGVLLVGECGVGPAADTTCTWSEVR